MAKQKQTRVYSAEEKAVRRLQHDTTKFQMQQTRDEKGICIPSYENYTATLGQKAPAWEILANPANATKVYMVKDSVGNDVFMSLEWLAGFFDGEGTIAIFLTRNNDLSLKFQIQSAFVLTQGVADFYLLTAIANFLGYGTVNVNRTDETSTRYQIRIVDPEILVKLIIPLFRIVKLRTKKKDEFLIWAELTEQLAVYEHYKDWPQNMLKFIEKLRQLKYVGLPTNQALDYLSTCNDLESNVKSLPKAPKETPKKASIIFDS